MDAPFVTTPEASRYLRATHGVILSPSTLATDRVRGALGIPWVKLSGRCYYLRRDLDTWVEQAAVRRAGRAA